MITRIMLNPDEQPAFWVSAKKCVYLRDNADGEWFVIEKLLVKEGFEVKRRGNTCFFSKRPSSFGGYCEYSIAESSVHKVYKEAIANLKRVRVLCGKIDVILNVKYAKTEFEFKGRDGKTRKADVVLFLDSTTPPEFIDACGGMVIVEIYNTNEVDPDKKRDIKEKGFTAFEYTINEKFKNWKNTESNKKRITEYFTYDEMNPNNHFLGVSCIFFPEEDYKNYR